MNTAVAAIMELINEISPATEDEAAGADSLWAQREAFETLANRATKLGVESRPFRIHAPLLHWTKARIVKEADRLGIDVSGTVSCYDPGPEGEPCSRCDACVLRARGFREAGLVDPTAGVRRADS